MFQRAFAILVGIIFAVSLPVGANAETATFKTASPYQFYDALNDASFSLNEQIKADFSMPDSAGQEQVGALIIMHGSGGIRPRHQNYVDMADDLGMASFLVDSFGHRGVSSTVGNQSNVTCAMMTIDALAALKFLAGHPRIDPSRIALVGTSKGGCATLYSAWNPIRNLVVQDLDFAARAAVYPACMIIEDANISAKPTKIFIGGSDNYTPPSKCENAVEYLRGKGKDWQLKIYPGGLHSFDRKKQGIEANNNAFSLVDCDFALKTNGIEYEMNSGYELTKAERKKALGACVKKGTVRSGGDRRIASQMFEDLKALLSANIQ